MKPGLIPRLMDNDLTILEEALREDSCISSELAEVVAACESLCKFFLSTRNEVERALDEGMEAECLVAFLNNHRHRWDRTARLFLRLVEFLRTTVGYRGKDGEIAAFEGFAKDVQAASGRLTALLERLARPWTFDPSALKSADRSAPGRVSSAEVIRILEGQGTD